MFASSSRFNSPVLFALLVAVIIGVGCWRTALTYDVFWQTWDEPFHIAAGMEWLEKGEYTYERFHPPLARVIVALGPYLTGVRGRGDLSSHWDEGNAILHTNGAYERNLSLARCGNLVFFVSGSLIVALWALFLFGRATSLLATLLFTTLPPIVAHAGLATLDMASAASVAGALFALTLWCDTPTMSRGVLVGLTTGLACLSKMSALAFLPLAAGVIGIVIIVHLFRRRQLDSKTLISQVRRWSRHAALAFVTGALTIWAGYQFSARPLARPENRPHDQVDAVLGKEGIAHDVSYAVVEHAFIPAPDFFKGVSNFRDRNNDGQLAIFMGDISRKGWWFFFPVMLLVKTPLPFLILMVVGFICAAVYCRRRESARLPFVILIAATLVILGIGAVSSVDNGVRQVLSVYPLFAIVAGFGASRMFRTSLISTALVGGLVTWQIVASLGAHPDYLAYFNELASANPEQIVVVGDLDWGQDLKRLSTELKNRGITDFAIKYNGSPGLDLNRFNITGSRELKPYQKTTGWVAISVQKLKLGTGNEPFDQFAWLEQYEPVERVGKSILLYYVPSE